ncbi:hypothetical protein [Arthrobacter sp. efr-133-TYG-118]|uniref:hypothetical protein n=1 Tax=Arthrobacter sp. efr-133-TYG-118 TaxID=3040279 RepID=UPI00254ECB28|nr:hypothetical protein [Arthrobacter sp. efr-133-TYG-118]
MQTTIAADAGAKSNARTAHSSQSAGLATVIEEIARITNVPMAASTTIPRRLTIRHQ